jgi:hypothetical protein
MKRAEFVLFDSSESMLNLNGMKPHVTEALDGNESLMVNWFSTIGAARMPVLRK